ncbi:MAG: hypothetical protein JWR72_2653 [Flavisolibacter sp.]|jgi:hypothetical protein|nr:hypothetical protein [Flavisolibacter sp.]
MNPKKALLILHSDKFLELAFPMTINPALLRYSSLLAVIILLITCSTCQRESGSGTKSTPLFDSIPVVVPVIPLIAEASGIADSKKIAGNLWVQEDSGNPPQLTLLKHNGAVQRTVYIKGAVNRDWEDIVLAGTDIYIGDVGDNNAVYPDYTFYKFPEPGLNIDTVTAFETIRFRYADGAHDAEAFLVEPSAKNIYIITKRDVPSRIFKLTAPFISGTIYTAEEVGRLSYTGVVSAALSADAKEIIIKTYLSLNYYKIGAGEKIETALQKAPAIIPYQIEPQGEAVCFSNDNNGYFTVSEKGFGSDVKLYFYKRN